MTHVTREDVKAAVIQIITTISLQPCCGNAGCTDKKITINADEINRITDDLWRKLEAERLANPASGCISSDYKRGYSSGYVAGVRRVKSVLAAGASHA